MPIMGDSLTETPHSELVLGDKVIPIRLPELYIDLKPQRQLLS